MAIQVALNHKTQYLYDKRVTLEPHLIRLRPAPHCRTPILSYSLRVSPQPHFVNWQQDPYGNHQARIVFLEPTRELSVEVDLIAELSPFNPFDFFIEPYATHSPFTYEAILARELVPYLEISAGGPRLTAFVEGVRRYDIRNVDYLVGINQSVREAVNYIVRLEPGVQTPEETLTLGWGSCRDSAWLLVQVLRSLGLAARFVSGYLVQLVADVKPLEGPAGPEKDFTDLHAWAEVYLPGAGWIGLDPTSGLLAGEGHLPLACAAEPDSAAPTTGSYGWTPEPGKAEQQQCKEEFRFEMRLDRIHEIPRVTKPYAEDQWQAIDALGRCIDADLLAQDVRLTMGGEPTFVSVDDRESPEWNFTALGVGKQRQACALLLQLRDRFAVGGFLHYGQGKWYPGESLPRWAYGCYWRRDGVPVWSDPLLSADPQRDYGHGPAEALAFLTSLAVRLGVEASHSVSAYEDIWYYIWRERRLPVNVDPLDSKLDDAEERKRLAKVFEQGLDHVVGHALPLRRRSIGSGWESGRWLLRGKHLFLIPGDSPMGYRLPLEALPWEAPAARDAVAALDPFAPRGQLPDPRSQSFRTPPETPLANGVPTQGDPLLHGVNGHRGQSSTTLVRTALCVEARGGVLRIFLPPVEVLEDYLELIGAVEATAAELQLPVVLEGYRPPADHRLAQFQLTPDPGVLEVNIQPAHSWQELAENTTVLYDEAHRARLSAEKFMQDGRHTGTGGGNHMVLGGPTPADSPILRRPDLLRSLLACWHNHPSLSYLFSGLFVGPTSQAPRVDEARNDSLYEMEIAFQQIPARERAGSPAGHDGALPWLVDRVFRHLLVDVTGNRHRAEFCIDKLYSPDFSGDRRGLVELRGFEMPPNARMSLVQQLLIRVLVTHFWKTPNRQRLARWGTELHDRFMLPYFVEQDFDDLLLELSQAGYAMQPAWFRPHLEFRFPLLGSVTHRGVYLELRQAIEPWHVLGEEQAQEATARYVDSSVERVQVLVRGLTDTRHLVLCNGRRVPLHPTGVNGEFVAGVRYRAWQPPSCLHPMIPVHTPLVFDIYDTWTGRSLGGCQYHVTHPGGRAYEDFPVNANSAEARRRSRFFAFGHSPGRRAEPPLEMRPECPFTLDLRQQAPPTREEPGTVLDDSPPVWVADILRTDQDATVHPMVEEALRR